jgi:phage gpG-like protein
MISVDIQFRAKKAAQALEKLQTLDFFLIHSSLGEDLINIIGDRFDRSVGPKGEKWPKIKRYFNQSWRRWRTPRDRPLKLLDLYKSFSYDASAEEVVVGTPKTYAKYHSDFPSNNGGQRKIMPLREFMGIESDNDIDTLLDTVEGYLEKTLPASGEN